MEQRCVFSQDDEGANGIGRSVVEREASSHPHCPASRQRETVPENIRRRHAAESYSRTKQHHTKQETR